MALDSFYIVRLLTPEQSPTNDVDSYQLGAFHSDEASDPYPSERIDLTSQVSVETGS
jgi:hypothetical protein